MYMLTNVVYFLIMHFSSATAPGMLSSARVDFNLLLTFLGLNMWIYPLDVESLEAIYI